MCPHKRELRYRLVDWVYDYGAPVASLIGAAGVTVTSAIKGPLLVVILFAAVVFCGGISSIFQKERLSDLDNRLRQSEDTNFRARQALNRSIEHFARSLSQDVGLWSTDIRATVYAHDRANGRFIPLARVSKNPNYTKLNRQYYPDNQGFLALAWAGGSASAYKLTTESAKAKALEGGMSEDVYDNLPFKLMSCYGCSVTVHDEPLGVIFWESIDPLAINSSEKNLDRVSNRKIFSDLASVLSAASSLSNVLSAHEFDTSCEDEAR